MRRVAVDYGSHTNQVEDIRDLLAETLAGITAQAPGMPFYSTVTGEWIQDAGVVDGDYWYRNLRNQVRFGPAVATLLEQGHEVFVEISPHPVVVQPISEWWTSAIRCPGGGRGSLRREDGGLRRLLTSMAELYVRGVAIDWSATLPAVRPGQVELPTYAFEHQHYWLMPAAPAIDAVSLGQAAVGHPLLGAVVQLPQSDGMVFTSRLSLRSHPWLADHAIGGVVHPAGLRARGTGRCGPATRPAAPVLDELVIEAPLVVPEQGGVRGAGRGERPGRDRLAHRRRVLAARRRGRVDPARDRPGVGNPGSGTAFDFTGWPPQGARAGRRRRLLRRPGRARLRLRTGVPGAAGGVAAR